MLQTFKSYALLRYNTQFTLKKIFNHRNQNINKAGDAALQSFNTEAQLQTAGFKHKPIIL